MNFSSPERVAQIIAQLKEAEEPRAENRALINSLFNGTPPYTEAEEKDNNIRVNVNWGEGADLMLQGREQYENAHLSPDPVIKIKVPNAPPSQATEIGEKITTRVNALFRKSRMYLHTRREKWAAVALHGIGPMMWQDQDCWCPFFVGQEDLRIPTDTPLTLEGMNHFAVLRGMTPGQLFRKTFGKPEGKRDPGWNMEAVKKVLADYKDENGQSNDYNWLESPEKMTELWKQNAGYYDSDRIPKIWMWDFYHQEDDQEKPCWYRKIVLDKECVSTRRTDQPVTYVYERKEPYADSIDQIIHFQFADGNNVPPFKYHSVRSLGLRLFDAVHMLNRLRCQFLQKVFEDLMNLFRVTDPTDRSRLEQIYLGLNYGIFPEGLNFVTRDQRYSPDPKLVEMQLSNLKQLLGEGSQQYTQDIDTGTNKERTAFEVSTLLNQTTKLTGSMLNLSYLQEYFAYVEICRRLCKQHSTDWEVKKLRQDLLNDGVAEHFIDADQWVVELTRVLGNGNPQLEAAQAKALMEVRPALDPEAQTEVLHEYVFAITHDPQRAKRLVPLDGRIKVSETVHDTEQTFGAIMAGSPVRPKPGLNGIEVIDTMLLLIAGTIRKIQQRDNIGDRREVEGLQTAGAYTDLWIKQLDQDQANQQRVKQWTDILGKLENEVKGFAQRLMEKEQAENPQNPELMKAQMEMQLEQQKAQVELRLAEAKAALEEKEFHMEQRRKDMELQADLVRMRAELQADIQKARMEMQTQIQLANQEFAAEQRRKDAESEANVKRTEAQAKAAAKAKPAATADK